MARWLSFVSHRAVIAGKLGWMHSRLTIITLAVLANVDSALAVSPERPTADVPQVATPAEANSSIEASTACYEQSLAPGGNTASCDALIDQAQLETPGPIWLASAHTSRGLIIARQATTQADPEALTAALRDYETAAQLAPQRVEPQINQANVLLALGRAPEALARYDKIIATPSAANQRYLSVALFNRAIAYRALGDLDRAQADLDQARSLDQAAQQRAQLRFEGDDRATTPVTPR